MQIAWTLVESIVLGLVCSIPGLIVDTYLARKGIVRGSKHIIVLGSVIGLIVARILFSQIPLWAIMIAITLSVPSGAFRIKFLQTSRRGRWWWTKDEEG